MDQQQLHEAIARGYMFYDSIKNDKHHRYNSWEYCHRVFLERRNNTDADTVDYLCLHLAWYLASWGMLRGGAFLLQKDYKIHEAVVKLLCQPEWNDLWDITPDKLAQEKYAQRIMILSREITKVYATLTGKLPSDTLLTKILLGTIGCTPAYDRYFKEGLKRAGLTQQFGVRSLMQVGKLYQDNSAKFEDLRRHCSSRIDYPPVKILDMCFFESGMEEE